MVYTDSIKAKVKSQEFLDITSKVEEIMKDSGVQNGICSVFSVGSTSAILINENEPMLMQDLKNSLEKIAPKEDFYQHMENAHSHIKSSIVGNSKTIPVKDGSMVLGTWQGIMLANFDVEEREREVVVTVIGD
jgi:secondary thiamine-phosphate synthase enzyme